MSNEQINITIAEYCGTGRNHLPPTVDPLYYYEPDYCNDLNAMHEVEKVLTSSHLSTYERLLACFFTDHPHDGLRFAIYATALQRAEAYLRTIGKWVEA